MIDYLRGKEAVDRVRACLEAGDTPVTTGINVEEIVRGLRSDEIQSADDLVAGLEVLPIGAREGFQAGEWRRRFAQHGVTLWQADCLVAACAYAAGATLVTGNPKDFPMEELTVEHWPVGKLRTTRG